MYKEKVTIIVGIYNSSRFLQMGLDSIFNQTWENIEVLLMDDGSTDDSGQICDEYVRKDERFRVIHKENGGVCDSRNMGLEIATGEYVCFMDGDDWLENDYIEYLMTIIHRTNTKMAITDKLYTTKDRVQVKKDKVQVITYEKAITNIIYPYMTLGPWNKIYNLSLIKENNIRFPEHWMGETLHFANTVAYYAGKVGLGHRKIYNYRLDNFESATILFNVENRILSLENAEELKNCIFAKTRRIKNAINWHLYENYFNLLVHILATDSKEKYLTEYEEAIRYLKKNCLCVTLKSKLKIKQRIGVF